MSSAFEGIINDREPNTDKSDMQEASSGSSDAKNEEHVQLFFQDLGTELPTTGCQLCLLIFTACDANSQSTQITTIILDNMALNLLHFDQE